MWFVRREVFLRMGIENSDKQEFGIDGYPNDGMWICILYPYI